MMLWPTLGLGPALFGAGDAETGGRLPGSGLTVQDALDRSDLVVVAKVTGKGRGGELSGGGEHFSGMRIEILDRLKGDAGEELSLGFKVYLTRARPERAPVVGREYLFFLRRPNEEQVWTVKVAPRTEETVHLAETLLKGRPLPGSGTTVREAVEYARVVAVARVVEVFKGGAGEPGKRPYHAKVKITRCLKGETLGEHFVYLLVQVAPNDQAEEVPRAGQEYLFFLSRPPGEEIGAIKVVRPTESMLRRAEELLAD